MRSKLHLEKRRFDRRMSSGSRERLAEYSLGLLADLRGDPGAAPRVTGSASRIFVPDAARCEIERVS